MHRLGSFLLTCGLLCLASAGVPGQAIRQPATDGAVSVDEVFAEFDRLTQRTLWPGFDPRTIPLAIFDGSATWLVRHPAPPAPFRRRDRDGEVWFVPGRHEAVRANTHASIGDALAATLIIDPADGHSARDLAGTLIHEAFHVYQATEHPDWFANEMQLLSYPWEMPGLIALRRLEGDALRLALVATRPGEGACWAEQALGFRRTRYADMSAPSAEYERALELAEGLATYVEGLALGIGSAEIMSGQPFPPEAVRQRAYASGNALAVLLDRYAGSWKLELERETEPLDQLLAAAVREVGDSNCGFSAREMEAAGALAKLEVATELAAREATRAEYMARSGWRLHVVSHGEPLWPNAFDPLNMRVLGGNEVLHSRWLELGNNAGKMVVSNRGALTMGAGEHPLFEGVRRTILTGLSVEPELEEDDGRLMIRGQGIRGEFELARVERLDRMIVIHLQEGN